MAEELAYRSSAPESAPSPATSDIDGTFPAGSALVLLGISFVLLRVVVRATVEHRALGSFAVLTGAAGAVLAAFGLVAELVRAARKGAAGPARGAAVVRLALAAPVVLLVFAALHGEPPEALQWLGLASAGATVLAAGVSAQLHARGGMAAARVALALLTVGELVELFAPPVNVVAAPGTLWPNVFARASVLSELCALVGAAAAVVWSLRATSRVAGAARARLFLPLPVFLALVFSLFAASMPVRIAVAVARGAFGARFDLFLAQSPPVELSTGAILLYLLIPELVLCAACVSVAGVLFDRGASARRALGWMAVLLAGFGAVRLAGPMDPLRLVLVSLGVVLLERAAVLEAHDRAAPAA